MEDEKCDKKFKEMQEYVPSLEQVLNLLKSAKDDPPESPGRMQYQRLTLLHDLLTKSGKKLKYETLLKCESVLVKLHYKIEKNESTDTSRSNVQSTEDDDVIIISPDSPDVRAVTPNNQNQPIIIPTERRKSPLSATNTSKSKESNRPDSSVEEPKGSSNKPKESKVIPTESPRSPESTSSASTSKGSSRSNSSKSTKQSKPVIIPTERYKTPIPTILTTSRKESDRPYSSSYNVERAPKTIRECNNRPILTHITSARPTENAPHTKGNCDQDLRKSTLISVDYDSDCQIYSPESSWDELNRKSKTPTKKSSKEIADDSAAYNPEECWDNYTEKPRNNEGSIFKRLGKKVPSGDPDKLNNNRSTREASLPDHLSEVLLKSRESRNGSASLEKMNERTDNSNSIQEIGMRRNAILPQVGTSREQENKARSSTTTSSENLEEVRKKLAMLSKSQTQSQISHSVSSRLSKDPAPLTTPQTSRVHFPMSSSPSNAAFSANHSNMSPVNISPSYSNQDPRLRKANNLNQFYASENAITSPDDGVHNRMRPTDPRLQNIQSSYGLKDKTPCTTPWPNVSTTDYRSLMSAHINKAQMGNSEGRKCTVMSGGFSAVWETGKDVDYRVLNRPPGDVFNVSAFNCQLPQSEKEVFPRSSMPPSQVPTRETAPCGFARTQSRDESRPRHSDTESSNQNYDSHTRESQSHRGIPARRKSCASENNEWIRERGGRDADLTTHHGFRSDKDYREGRSNQYPSAKDDGHNRKYEGANTNPYHHSNEHHKNSAHNQKSSMSYGEYRRRREAEEAARNATLIASGQASKEDSSQVDNNKTDKTKTNPSNLSLPPLNTQYRGNAFVAISKPVSISNFKIPKKQSTNSPACDEEQAKNISEEVASSTHTPAPKPKEQRSENKASTAVSSCSSSRTKAPISNRDPRSYSNLDPRITSVEKNASKNCDKEPKENIAEKEKQSDSSNNKITRPAAETHTTGKEDSTCVTDKSPSEVSTHAGVSCPIRKASLEKYTIPELPTKSVPETPSEEPKKSTELILDLPPKPQRIIRRRQTMFDVASEPVVDKEKLNAANALVFEDLPDKNTKKKVVRNRTRFLGGCIAFEKTDDNCMVSTSNIIEGKRRTRADVNLNETLQMRSIFNYYRHKDTKSKPPIDDKNGAQESNKPDKLDTPESKAVASKNVSSKAIDDEASKSEDTKANTEKDNQAQSKTGKMVIKKEKLEKGDKPSLTSSKKPESLTSSKIETVHENVQKRIDELVERLLDEEAEQKEIDSILNLLKPLLGPGDFQVIAEQRARIKQIKEQSAATDEKPSTTSKSPVNKIIKSEKSDDSSAKTGLRRGRSATPKAKLDDDKAVAKRSISTSSKQSDRSMSPASTNSTKPPKKAFKKRNELERLHDDIDEMFIRNDVLSATGRRAAALNKSATSEAAKVKDPKSEKLNASKEEPKANAKKTEIKIPERKSLNMKSTRNLSRTKRIIRRKNEASSDESSEDNSSVSESEYESEVDENSGKSNSSDHHSESDTASSVNAIPMPKLKPIKHSPSDKKTETDVEENSERKPKTNKRKLLSKPCPKSKKPAKLSKNDKSSDDELTEKADKSVSKKKPGNMCSDDKVSDTAKAEDDLAKREANILKLKQEIYSTDDDALLAKIPQSDPSNEVVLKNNNPKWHAFSRYNKMCVLCERKVVHTGWHYFHFHDGEHYTSRVSPVILSELLTNKKLCKATAGCKDPRGLMMWLYRCPFCLQFKKYRKTILLEHLISHTGEYIYQCSRCPFTCNSIGAFTKHAKKCKPKAQKRLLNDIGCSKQPASTIRAYVCHVCQYIRLNRDNLVGHYQKHHDYTEKEAAESGIAFDIFDTEDVEVKSDWNTLEQCEIDIIEKYESQQIIEIDADSSKDTSDIEGDDASNSISMGENRDRGAVDVSNQCENPNSPSNIDLKEKDENSSVNQLIAGDEQTLEPSGKTSPDYSDSISQLPAADKSDIKETRVLLKGVIRLPLDDQEMEDLLETSQNPLLNSPKGHPESSDVTIPATDQTNEDSIENNSSRSDNIDSINEHGTVLLSKSISEKPTGVSEIVESMQKDISSENNQQETNGGGVSKPTDANVVVILDDEDDDSWEDIEVVETARKYSSNTKKDKLKKPKISGWTPFKAVYGTKNRRVYPTPIQKKKEKAKPAGSQDERIQPTTSSASAAAVTALNVETSLTDLPDASANTAATSLAFKPFVTRLEDLLPDSPSNDPVDTIPELVPQESLQDLNDISSYLDNPQSMPMDIDNPVGDVAVFIHTSADNHTTSIQEALNFTSVETHGLQSQYDSMVSVVEKRNSLPPNNASNTFQLKQLMQIQNVGFCKKSDNSYIFRCLVKGCSFMFSNEYIGLEDHCLQAHSKTVKWNGRCATCQENLVYKDNAELPLQVELKHLLEVHMKPNQNSDKSNIGASNNVVLAEVRATANESTGVPSPITVAEETTSSCGSSLGKQAPRIKVRLLPGDWLSKASPSFSSSSNDLPLSPCNFQLDTNTNNSTPISFSNLCDDNLSLTDLLNSNPKPMSNAGKPINFGVLNLSSNATLNNSTASTSDSRNISVLPLQITRVESLHGVTPAAHGALVQQQRHSQQQQEPVSFSNVLNADGNKSDSGLRVGSVCSLNEGLPAGVVVLNTSGDNIGALWSQQVFQERESLKTPALNSLDATQRLQMKDPNVSIPSTNSSFVSTNNTENDRHVNNESPGPLIVSEIVPLGQATTGNFLITQTVSAQYDTNTGSNGDAQLGFNISIAPTNVGSLVSMPSATATQNIQAQVTAADCVRNISSVSAAPNFPARATTANISNNTSTQNVSIYATSNSSPFYKCMAGGCKFQSRIAAAMKDHLGFHQSQSFTKDPDFLRCSLCSHVAADADEYIEHCNAHHMGKTLLMTPRQAASTLTSASMPILPLATTSTSTSSSISTLISPSTSDNSRMSTANALTQKIRNILNTSCSLSTSASSTPIPITEPMQSNTEANNRLSNADEAAANAQQAALFRHQLEESVLEMTANSGIPEKNVYRCVVKNCTTLLSDESSFTTHVSYHTGTTTGYKSNFPCPHCDATFKSLPPIKAHIKNHIEHTYFCHLCLETSNEGQILKHYNESHMRLREVKTYNFLTIVRSHSSQVKYFVANQTSLSTQDIKNFSAKLVSEWQRRKAASRTHFKSGEVDLLPTQPIFQRELFCGECQNYKSKVRTNMVRHLLWHKANEGSTISSEQFAASTTMDPVNPVPCLINNEKHFDRMTNLSSSSLLSLLSNNNTQISATSNGSSGSVNEAEQLRNKLPPMKYAFVPTEMRYMCNVTGCNHLTLTEDNFKAHLHALHASVTKYVCPLCKEDICKRGMTPDRVVQHLRFHDKTLYRCECCGYVHYLKYVALRHINEKHTPAECSHIIIHKRSEQDPIEGQVTRQSALKLSKTQGSTATNLQQESSNNTSLSNKSSSASSSLLRKSLSNPNPGRTTSNSWTEYYMCNICDVKNLTSSNISAHCKSSHGTGYQYKCTRCDYGAAVGDKIMEHAKKEHYFMSNNMVPILMFKKQLQVVGAAGREISRMEETAPPPRPLWQRDDPNRIRHIRGILMEDEEESERHRKRLRLDDDNDDELEDDTCNLFLGCYEFVCFYCPTVKASCATELKSQHWQTTHNQSSEAAMPFLYRLQQRLKCPECQSFTGVSNELKNHLAKAHEQDIIYAADVKSKRLVCGFCDATSSTARQLQLHSANEAHEWHDVKGLSATNIGAVTHQEVGLAPATYAQCTVCSQIFANRYAVAVHGKEKHPNEEFSFTECFNETMFRCAICSFCSRAETQLMRHQVDHYPKFERCNFCGQPQESLNGYMQHCYSDHRSAIKSFADIHPLSDMKKFLQRLFFIFPNGLIITKKDLRNTPFGKTDCIDTLYAEICKTAQQPPIPRLSVGSLLRKKSIEAQQQKMAAANGYNSIMSPPSMSMTAAMQLAGHHSKNLDLSGGAAPFAKSNKIRKRRSTVAVAREELFSTFNDLVPSSKRKKLSTTVLAPPTSIPQEKPAESTQSIDVESLETEGEAELEPQPYSFYGVTPEEEDLSKIFTRVSITSGVDIMLSIDKFNELCNTKARLVLKKLTPREIEKSRRSAAAHEDAGGNPGQQQGYACKKACPASEKYKYQ